jgi:hydrogenase expression/formation protein HypC
MCLAAPARVISVSDNTAVVDYGGVETTTRLDTLPEPVAPGDYVLIHTGFAIRRLSPEDGEETLRLFDELANSLQNATRTSEESAPRSDDDEASPHSPHPKP